MRYLLASIVLAVTTLLASAANAQPDPRAYYDDTDPSALIAFRSALDPYGSWVNDPTYGTVWVPNRRIVGAQFTPYVTGGHWAYDDSGGYVWVSDYPWGWAPFHYGRWVTITNVGWAWIPGRTYAGAWVNWRVGDQAWDYVGWTPAPPSWIWRGGRAVRLGYTPRPAWTYVPHRNLFDRDVRGFVSRGPGAVRIERHTREYMRPPGAPHAGPPPGSFGRQRPNIVRPPRHDPGLDRARQLSRPPRR